MTSLPLPLRGKNGGRPAGNGKKEGVGQVVSFFILSSTNGIKSNMNKGRVSKIEGKERARNWVN